ncbi:MAG: methyltransferase domain-containing protein [Cytophagales bacterium]|nr:methyltransferase domain-containing protein [Cytophagales bacterium]MDW8383445.1 methyltransferase domain-containing protein [Flammeovirgaceae bacterium]
MNDQKRIDPSLFIGTHYLGKPAEITDKIVHRRIGLVRSFPDFCGKQYDMVEVGCGSGATMLLMANDFKTCTGIELFAKHREKYEKLFQELGTPSNCTFHILNIEQEDFPQKFDRLISFEVIEHLESEESVARFADLLRTGGLAAISVPNKWWIFEQHGAKLPLLPWNRVPFFSWLPTPIHETFANARIYTQKRIKNLLESHGFQVLKMEYITAPMDVLKPGRFKSFVVNHFFNTETTKNPLKSTSIFVVAKKR